MITLKKLFLAFGENQGGIKVMPVKGTWGNPKILIFILVTGLLTDVDVYRVLTGVSVVVVRGKGSSSRCVYRQI